ncbi:unnamed protein product, partial [Ectocarpus sp. 8 AP-2014]
ANGSLGETAKAMWTAIPAHYKVNMMARAVAFGSQKDPHMGLQPGGTPLAPRATTKITVTGCSDRNDTDGGYQRLEEAIKRVVVHSATSLRSIAVTGRADSYESLLELRMDSTTTPSDQLGDLTLALEAGDV